MVITDHINHWPMRLPDVLKKTIVVSWAHLQSLVMDTQRLSLISMVVISSSESGQAPLLTHRKRHQSPRPVERVSDGAAAICDCEGPSSQSPPPTSGCPLSPQIIVSNGHVAHSLQPPDSLGSFPNLCVKPRRLIIASANCEFIDNDVVYMSVCHRRGRWKVSHKQLSQLPHSPRWLLLSFFPVCC